MASFSVSQFLECSIECKSNDPESTPQSPPLWGSHLGHCPPALIWYPGPGTRQLGRAYWNYSNKPTLSLLSLPHLFLPLKPQLRLADSHPSTFASWLALVFLCVALYGMACPLLVGLMKCVFNGSNLLIGWPYHTSNFILIHYILKQGEIYHLQQDSRKIWVASSLYYFSKRKTNSCDWKRNQKNQRYADESLILWTLRNFFT